MSTTIDERVVEMRFDNKQFESNVQTSLSTLSKLKEGLNLDGATKGLEQIGAATKGLDMSGLATAVDTVKDRFSAMEVIAITALANITNSAVNAGKQLVASLTIDQVTAGWDKYADKTSAVQTIMAATAKDFTDTGEQMEYVNGQLEKLNWFTDETSYNFLDMVSNIGKFTSNGVKLDTAVTAMEGISTWAAISGANTQEASRAMYNLSQALAVGSVKLIDWKSIENANMATVEFKQTAIDTAVALGTLTEVGDGLYETLDGNEVSVSNFNENLKDAWFSSEVLLETLNRYGGFTDKLYEASEAMSDQYDTVSELISAVNEYKDGTLDLQEVAANTGLTIEEVTGYFDDLADSTMELGRKSFAAAQEAKTFQEAIDATKDAVSTGWMNTFELIFGNYEEAKKLWTNVANELYDVFASSAEARNELLGEWKELGGRDALLEAFANAWNGLKEVVEGVKEAFRDVFPAMTAERLVEITENLRDLTAKFKMSDETAENLKNTFRGLFAALDIVKQAVSAVLGGLKPLLSFLPGMSGGILGVTGSIGEWIYNLDQFLKENDTFKVAVENVVSFIQSIPGKIDAVFQKLTGSSIGEAFEAITEKASGALDALKQVFSGFRDIDLSGVDSFTERIKLRFEPLGVLFEGVKKVFTGLWEFFKKLLPVFAGIATAIGNALGSLGDALMNALGEGDFSTILDILNGGVLAAIALGIKKFVDSLSDITSGASGMLESITGILDGVKGCFEAWQQSLKASVLLKIAGAIAILTASLLVLSMIDSDKLLMSLAAITTEFGVLMGSLSVMTKILDGKVLMNDLRKMAAAMLTMSAAVLVLAFAMKTIASLDWDGVLKGLVSVTVLIAALTISAKELSKGSGQLVKGASSLLLFALAIRALVGPVKELGSLDLATLAKGLIGVGVLMAELAAFMKLADFDGVGVTKGLAMVLMAEALKIMAAAVEKIGAIDTGALVKGLIGMAAVLAEIAAFSKVMGDAKHITSTAVGLTIMGAAMLIFSKAIESMGSLSIEQIAKGLLAMGGALAEVAVAMKFLPNNTAVIGIGLIAVGAALNIIDAAVKNMAEMTWEEIAKGLVALAGSLLVITVALNAMTGALPGAAAMLVVSAALAIFVPMLKIMGGMSWGEIAKGLLTLAAAFAVIGVAGLVLAPVVPTLLGLGGAIALLGVGLAAAAAAVLLFATALSALAVSGAAGAGALVLIITSIAGTIPVIIQKIGEGIVEFCKAIANGAPAVVEAAVTVIVAVCKGLIEALPTVVETVVTLIVAVLETLADHMPEIVQSGIDILLAFLKGIADNISEVVQTAVDIVINLIDGIAKKIPDVIQCGWDVIISFIDGLADSIEKNTPRMIEAITNLGKAILNAFLSFFGIHSPSTVMKEQGVNIVQGIIEGIKNKFQAARDAVRDLGEKMLSKIKEYKDKFTTAAKDIVQGLINGIKNKITDIATAATDIGKTLLNGVKSFLGIESPSREMAALGMYSDEGFAQGLRKFAGKVAAAAKGVGNTALDSMSGVVSSLGAIIGEDIPDDPVIRPVLDLSNIEAGAGRISSMLDADRTFKMADYNGRMLSARGSGINEPPEIKVDNGDIVSAVNKLGRDFASMMDILTHLQVVLDNGTLVGELVGPIDTALGTRVTRNWRERES